MCCFFAVFLGLKEGTRGLVLNVMRRFGEGSFIRQKRLDGIIAVFLVLIATGNTLLNWKILYYTLLCSPIFGIAGCFVPTYLVYKLPELHKYKGVHLYLILFVGILLCMAPFLAFIS